MTCGHTPFISCIERQEKLSREFLSLPDAKARYERLMQMGRALPPTDPLLRRPQNLVAGCQSEVFLAARMENDKVFFSVSSDALISAGLAALLLAIYDGESVETILGCPPSCIADMGILTSLTPGRSNGLASMHLRMKQEAVRLLKNIHYQSNK